MWYGQRLFLDRNHCWNSTRGCPALLRPGDIQQPHLRSYYVALLPPLPSNKSAMRFIQCLCAQEDYVAFHSCL